MVRAVLAPYGLRGAAETHQIRAFRSLGARLRLARARRRLRPAGGHRRELSPPARSVHRRHCAPEHRRRPSGQRPQTDLQEGTIRWTCTPRSPARPCCCASKRRRRWPWPPASTAAHGGSWALFALLLLAPDLSALGYLAGPAAGAACYNAAHTYLVPAALGAVGLADRARATAPAGADLGGAHRPGSPARLRPEVPRRLQTHTRLDGVGMADREAAPVAERGDCTHALVNARASSAHRLGVVEELRNMIHVSSGSRSRSPFSPLSLRIMSRADLMHPGQLLRRGGRLHQRPLPRRLLPRHATSLRYPGHPALPLVGHSRGCGPRGEADARTSRYPLPAGLPSASTHVYWRYGSHPTRLARGSTSPLSTPTSLRYGRSPSEGEYR